MTRHSAHVTIVLTALAVVGAVPLTARAQGRLVGGRASAAGVTFEAWDFGKGIVEPTVDGADSVRIRRATQLSIPLTLAFPAGRRWTVDVASGYTVGEVSLDRADAAVGRPGYELRGLTDVRVRAVGAIVEDRITLTLGATIPTGATQLSSEEWGAARILAAPALGFTTPVLGSGGGATAGIVFARPMGGWAWAGAAAYEYRRSYSPVALVAGLPTPEFSPSDVIHLSLGGDRAVGQSRLTLGVSADVFGNDRLSSGDASGPASPTQLGPIFTGEAQWQIGTRRVRDLTFYVVDRYRSAYERDGETVSGSNGNYLDVGTRAVVGIARFPSLALTGGINLRHQTGLDFDRTLPTAAYRGVAAMIGAAQTIGGVYSVQPFLRGQLGTMETAGQSASPKFFGAGVTLGRRF